MRDVNCPYCGHGIDINHDDGYGYQEEVIYEEYCSSCDKYFGYTTSIHFSYDVHKADCMNKCEHNWQLTNTIPKYYTKMYCPDCGKERELTAEERTANKIESREDYMQQIKNL